MRPRMINAPHQVGRQMQGSFAVIAFGFRLTGHASSKVSEPQYGRCCTGIALATIRTKTCRRHSNV
jgi:hypothetical protein